MPMYAPFAGGNTAKPIVDCLDSMKTVAATVTTGSDTTQANATALTKAINVITTNGGAGRGVRLPTTSASTIGQTVFIHNATATSAQVFGGGTDTVNDVATATGVALVGNTGKMYVCAAAGKWYAA